MAGKTGSKTTSLMSKKDQAKALQAQGELKALKSKKGKSRSSNGSRKKSRPSVTGWLGFVIAPLYYAFFGLPGLTSPTGTSMKARVRDGFRAVLMAFTGIDIIERKFVPMALLYGYLPIGANLVVRKLKINRMAPRSVPWIL